MAASLCSLPARASPGLIDMDPTAYEDLIQQNAERFKLPVDLFRRLVEQESQFDPSAVSSKGAQGLGQVMGATARDPGYGVAPLAAEDLQDPAENLRFSAEYFSAMIDEFGDPALALAAYNAGPGAVKKHGGIPPFQETQDYVQKIMMPADQPMRPRARPTDDAAPLESLRPKLRPDDLQTGDKTALDGLGEALQYADLSKLAGAPRYRFDPPGIRRGTAKPGSRALKRLGIASLG